MIRKEIQAQARYKPNMMKKLTQREKQIIAILLTHGPLSSSAIHQKLTEEGEVSLVTVKRTVSGMAKNNLLASEGAGRSVVYTVSVLGRVYAEVDVRAYISIDPDKRYGLHAYNFELFPALEGGLFTKDELATLENATEEYTKKTADISPAIQKKELERLVIELSWKSSKIEGNTYTLLDTENLLRHNKPASGKTEEETQMILNHKEAFHFIHENKSTFQTLSRANIEHIHNCIVQDLPVGKGLRKNPVGVSGSIYRPLDNVHQIHEALEQLCAAIARVPTAYGKACLALLGISYIQPFEDGNKRTSRLAADAVLMAHGCAPLSYRSVDEVAYREAMLVFYELNSIVPFKCIFIDQYRFAATNYAVV